MKLATLKKPVTTYAATAPIATVADLEANITRLGEVERERDALTHRMETDLEEIKAQHSAPLQRLDLQAKVLRLALAEASTVLRPQLLKGESKTATLGAHLVAFRLQPPKVEIRSLDKVIAAIKRMRLGKRFLRTKEEINREALLADVKRAETIPGVTIRDDREEVVITPFGAAQ